MQSIEAIINRLPMYRSSTAYDQNLDNSSTRLNNIGNTNNYIPIPNVFKDKVNIHKPNTKLTDHNKRTFNHAEKVQKPSYNPPVQSSNNYGWYNERRNKFIENNLLIIQQKQELNRMKQELLERNNEAVSQQYKKHNFNNIASRLYEGGRKVDQKWVKKVMERRQKYQELRSKHSTSLDKGYKAMRNQQREGEGVHGGEKIKYYYASSLSQRPMPELPQIATAANSNQIPGNKYGTINEDEKQHHQSIDDMINEYNRSNSAKKEGNYLNTGKWPIQESLKEECIYNLNKSNNKSLVEDSFIHKDYGKVPKYIERFKEEDKDNKEYAHLQKRLKTSAKGTIIITEQERLDKIIAWKLERDGYIEEWNKLPIARKSPRQIVRQQEIEKVLDEIESQIHKYENKILMLVKS